ncbi:MAG: hypothetical protein ACFB2Z_06920, partial [Maricaulaceae bacterium]
RPPAPAIKAATEALVAHLGYTGAGCAQFMVDRVTGAISFLEINPRLGANFKIVEACGLPLTLWKVALAQGERPKPQRPPWGYKTGVRYAWTKGDLSGLARARRDGLGGVAALAWLGRTVWDGLRAPCHLTFDLRDPAPTLGLYLNKWLEGRVGPKA